jgi:Zn-dependent peptidase ImmA (M78 family)
MGTVRIGGHKYSDPDVLALISATGELVDPRSAVLNQARQVNAEYRSHDPSFSDPLQRIKIMASLRGLKVAPMNIERRKGEERDAILIPTQRGMQILFNPDRPKQRIAFSLAHEILHTFFRNSISGARFRSIHESESREANELERLCDLGAAELLMPIEDFQAETAGNYGLEIADQIANVFGSSFEATVYRMATANPGRAVAGLLKYRLSLPEQRALNKELNQQQLFSDGLTRDLDMKPKYRRQSLHLSEGCGDRYLIHWNKSFDPVSVVYRAAEKAVISAFEELPNDSGKLGKLQAIRAPYQREDAHLEFGDVLFFWQELDA